MLFHLDQAVLADVEDIARIWAEAWSLDPVFSQLMPSVHLAVQAAYLAKLLKTSLSHPEERVFKITVVESG
jgi:hypothetical protein